MKDLRIHYNQVGYLERKPIALASVSDLDALGNIGKSDGYELRIQPASGIDAASMDLVSWLQVENVENQLGSGPHSVVGVPIKVGSHIYRDAKVASVKGLYYQRCGCALEPKHAGPWAHAECHMAPGVLVEDGTTVSDIVGGWHDAGDYGRYISPGAVTVAMLLLAFDHMPECWGDDTGIPESGNGIPDILDEARWELEWMLKLQKADGSAYHKATSWGFSGMIMPEDDNLEIAISPVSPTATGTLAAVNAMASRIFRSIDATFADTLLDSAKRAWAWLEANPDAPGFRNPKSVSTGEYGDGDSRDERLWAATALYRATGDETFGKAALAMLEKWADVDKVTFGWTEVGGFAAAEVLFMEECMPELRDALYDTFIVEADRLVEIAKADGYHIPMKATDYIWGSTMVLSNRGVHLLLAHKLTGNTHYEDVAYDSLHWLLGRNPMGLCYLTGFGDAQVMNPHHRPSVADGVHNPVPGFISGGPNKGRSDPKAKEALPPDIPPAKAFVDDWESYSTNEIAIYWNSPVTFLLAWFDR